MPQQEVDREAVVDRFHTARTNIEQTMLRLVEVRDRILAGRESRARERSLREMLHDSAYARLLARLETQPVIEQAKGILMSESRCSADEAFELLRNASQRENVPVREIAARIVEKASVR